MTTIDKIFYNQLGKELRTIRQHREMTLTEVARITGFSRLLIDHLELGFNKIKPKYFERLCSALQVSPELRIDVKVGF